MLRRLLRRGRRRARPWHGAAVPPRPLPPPCRLQGHEAAARDTGSRLPFEPRMQPIGPSQPADDLVADLACSRTALSGELLADRLRRHGHEQHGRNEPPRSLTKAFARGCRPFKPLTAPQRPARLPRAALCLRYADGSPPRSFVWYVRTLPAQTRRFHCLAWPRRTARSRRARARATALMRARSWTRRAGRGWQHEPLAARGAEPEC